MIRAARATALALVVCAALGGCLGDSDEAGCEGGSGGTVAEYTATAPRGGPPEPGAVEAAIDVVCERARELDVAVEVQRRGADRLEISVEEDRERELDAIAAPLRLAFYDWEPNVFGDPNQPINGIAGAIRQAARAKPRVEPADVPDDRANDSAGDKHYVLDRRGDLVRPLGAPASNEANAFTTQPPEPRPGAKVVEVPRGVAIVKAEPPEGATPRTPAQYFVIEDDVELSGAEIDNPEQSSDPQTGEPVVTMEFTDTGRKAFARVTKRIARRGQEALPQPGSAKEDRFQRFMIAVDGQIVSLATIDFIANPEGIDASSGAQIGGIGSVEDTEDLAHNLRLGPLPVRLERVR